MTFPNRAVKTLATESKAHLDVVLPAGEYAEGLRLLAQSNRNGRQTWFLGQTYFQGGPKSYFPVVMALKWPTVLLLVFFASLLLGVRKTCRAPGDLLIFSLSGLVFLGFVLQSRITIGERHLLPLYPFVLLIAGGIWEHARRYRPAVALLALALCLNAADALRYAPDYLAYFNPFVRPANAWRLLTDSNLDWGQGLIAVRDYERQYPQELVHLAYFGSVAPELYGVRAVPLPPNQPVEGTIVAGGTSLSGQFLNDAGGYRWLWGRPARQQLDHSMWVFDTTRQPQGRGF
jgi:hypothetical protein